MCCLVDLFLVLGGGRAARWAGNRRHGKVHGLRCRRAELIDDMNRYRKNTAPSENWILCCRMKPSGSCDVAEQASTVFGETLRKGTTVMAAVGGRSPGSPVTSTEVCDVAPLESVACAVI